MSEAFFEIVEFVLESEKFFFIWGTTDEGKDFFENYYSRLVAFRDEKKAFDFLCSKGINAKKCKTVYDFDVLDYSNCDDFLSKWNIIDDLSKSILLDFVGNDDSFSTLYSKFVYGANFSALNKSKKLYTPSFDADELKQIEAIKSDMLRILKIALSKANFDTYFDFSMVRKKKSSDALTLINLFFLLVAPFVLLSVDTFGFALLFLLSLVFLISYIAGIIVSKGWCKVLNVFFLLLGIALCFFSFLFFVLSLIS